jgi:hypothetical protein
VSGRASVAASDSAQGHEETQGRAWVRIGRRLLSERVREESGFVASEREK